MTVPLPSPFIVEWAPRIAARVPPGSWALDLATGRGRHLHTLVRAGFRTVGVDRSLEALRCVVADAAGSGVMAFCADVTAYPLPMDRFHLVLVSRYLDRDRMPALKRSVAPGGFVLYETFTRHQLRYRRGPRSPEHLLAPGELIALFADFEIVFSDETTAPDALARLVARRPA